MAKKYFGEQSNTSISSISEITFRTNRRAYEDVD